MGREGIEPPTSVFQTEALPTELPPPEIGPVGPLMNVRPPWVEGRSVVPSGEFESPTSGVSSRRSYRLSYDGVLVTLKKT